MLVVTKVRKSCSKGEGKACCKKDASAKKACAGAATADAAGPKSCSKAKSCCKSKAMAATAVPADAISSASSRNSSVSLI